MRQIWRPILLAATVMVGSSTFAAAAPAAADSDKVAPSVKTKPTVQNKAASVDQRISELHAALQITPVQQPQWDQFAQVMRDNAKDMDDTFAVRMKTMPAMTAPENMESYAKVAMDHAQDVQKLVPAFQALYATLSDGQKHMADQLFRGDPSRPRRG